MAICDFPEIAGDLLSTNCMVRCQAVNCCGTMDTGLNAQVKEKYPEAAQIHAEMCKMFGTKLLGEVQFVPCHDGAIIANMYVRESDSGNLSVLDTGALEDCLDRLCIFAAKTGASLGIPKDLGQQVGQHPHPHPVLFWGKDVQLPNCEPYLRGGACRGPKGKNRKERKAGRACKGSGGAQAAYY